MQRYCGQVDLHFIAIMQALVGALKQALAPGARAYAAGVPTRKVAVLGAAGGIGQPLGLLMKVRTASTGLHSSARSYCNPHTSGK